MPVGRTDPYGCLRRFASSLKGSFRSSRASKIEPPSSCWGGAASFRIGSAGAAGGTVAPWLGEGSGWARGCEGTNRGAVICGAPGTADPLEVGVEGNGAAVGGDIGADGRTTRGSTTFNWSDVGVGGSRSGTEGNFGTVRVGIGLLTWGAAGTVACGFLKYCGSEDSTKGIGCGTGIQGAASQPPSQPPASQPLQLPRSSPNTCSIPPANASSAR